MSDNRSLKDKRIVLKSLKDQIRNRFNVSIAEVGRHDNRCSSCLAATVVSVDNKRAHQILESVVRFVERRGGAVVRDYHIQML